MGRSAPRVGGLRVGGRAVWLAVGVLALVLVVVGSAQLQLAGRRASGSDSAVTGLHRIGSLPMTAQSVISSAVGGGEGAFAARRDGAGWRLTGGGVLARFGGRRVAVSAGGGSASLALLGVGRGVRLGALDGGSLSADRNRVVYDRGWVREWYAAGPLGIEQGFTVAHRAPGAAGRLSLVFGLGGSLRAMRSGSELRFLTRAGRVELRYGGLVALDASGRRLPASLALRGRRLTVQVDDRGARYPVRIDPLIQQGSKLLDTSTAEPSISVALSSDGNTALVGDQNARSSSGSVWVFTRSGGVWSQQGPALAPSDEMGAADFGHSVALSADANTALIGGPFDAGSQGAVWVFTRSPSGVWTQQGQKIFVNDETPPIPATASFGDSVALSAGGTTALIGGDSDSSNTGAAWVWVKPPLGSWSEQKKLTVSGEAAGASVGRSVALSGDGNTALVGGPNDGSSGAAWVFARSGTSWSAPAKLTPQPASSSKMFGASVSLSSDGGTALIGDPGDSSGVGAAWVFTHSTGVWAQQVELTGQQASGNPAFGGSVALSQDGGTALIGGDQNNGKIGAAWVFSRSPMAVWSQQGSPLTAADETGADQFGAGVALSFDGDTALVGGLGDHSDPGAAWVFAPPTPSCANVGASTPAGGGAVAVPLSCTAPAGAALSYAVVTAPAHGAVGVINQATGEVTYTSQAGFAGQDTFTYRVSDQWGQSNTASATITVPPAIPRPSCANINATEPKGASKLTLALSCTAPAGMGFSFAIVTPPARGKLGPVNQATGRVTYTPQVGYFGADRFTYEAIDAGGASNTATATITIPRPPRLNPTMSWGFVAGRTYTLVHALSVNGVPGGAKVELACVGKHCPLKPYTSSTGNRRVCTGKGKKRHCKTEPPARTRTVNLTSIVTGRHFGVGVSLIVSTVQPGTIGKQYVFKMRSRHTPAVTITFLLPGTTKPCPGC